MHLEPAHLVGFSDGGEVGLLMAELAPGSISSLVTWGAAGMIHDPGGQLRNATATVVDDPIPPMQQFSAYLVEIYGRENALAMTRSLAAALDEIVAAGGDISLSRADRITCPALLIAGEHDPLVSADILRRLGSRIARADVVIVPGASHPLHMEQPEWLQQTMLEWLAGVDTASAVGSLPAPSGA
jgi:valacyclovir hydrolase